MARLGQCWLRLIIVIIGWLFLEQVFQDKYDVSNVYGCFLRLCFISLAHIIIIAILETLAMSCLTIHDALEIDLKCMKTIN